MNERSPASRTNMRPEQREQKNFMQRLRERASAVHAALALSLGAEALAGAGTAAAAEAQPEEQKQPEAAASDTEHKTLLDEKKEIQLDQDQWKSHYLVLEDLNVKGLESTGGRGFATLLEMIDEGDPNKKGDEHTVTAKFYRYEANGNTELVKQIQETGMISPRENTFGYISGFPKSIQEKSNPSMARTKANLSLGEMQRYYTLLKGFDAFDTEQSAECESVRQLLQKEVAQFQQQYPDIPLPQARLQEVGVQ